jgi:hypothetical protein
VAPLHVLLCSNAPISKQQSLELSYAEHLNKSILLLCDFKLITLYIRINFYLFLFIKDVNSSLEYVAQNGRTINNELERVWKDVGLV